MVSQQHGPEHRQAPVERSFLHRRHFAAACGAASSQSISGVQQDRGRGRSPPCRYGRAAGSSRVAFWKPRLRLGEGRGRQRRHDAVARRDHDQRRLLIFDGTMRLAAHRPLAGAGQVACRRTSRPGIRAPSVRRAARRRSASPRAARSRGRESPCWSMPRKRPNFFTASQGSSDQNRVCRISTGSSPTRSAISRQKRTGGDAGRRGRCGRRGSPRALRAAPARRRRRGRRAASATVSVPPMQ